MPSVPERPPLSTETPERAKQAAKTSKTSRARALIAAGTFACVVALIYVEKLAKVKPAGGNRLELWLLIALGVWASEAHPVRVRNRKMSLSIGLSEIPVLVGIVFLRPGLALGAAACGYFSLSTRFDSGQPQATPLFFS